MTLIEVERIRLVLVDDVPAAAFDPRSSLVADVPASPSSGLAPRRATIEFSRAVGGLPQRALLGGVWTPDTSGALRVEVALSGPWSHQPPSCTGPLGRALVPGLPDEYGPVVLGVFAESGLPAGDLTIDRAAHDLVESSSAAFTAAARVLVSALGTDQAAVVDVVEDRLRQIAAEPAWPSADQR